MLSLFGKRTFSTSTRILSDSTKSLYGFAHDSVSAAQREHEQVKVPVANKFVRRFEEATTYDPFDFSMAKILLDKKSKQDQYSKTTFDRRRLNPLDYYTNPKYLSEYLTSTGRILSRDVTKLSLKNQKRLAKSVKRARSAGLLSSVHRDIDFLNFKKNS